MRPILGGCAATLLAVALQACGGDPGVASEANDCWSRAPGGAAADCRAAVADDAAALGLLTVPVQHRSREAELDPPAEAATETESKTRPEAEPMPATEPVTESVTEPVTEPVTEREPPTGASPGTTPAATIAEPAEEIIATSEPEQAVDPTALQLTAIAAYNAREPGWQAAVEEALAHPELRNAPNLAFAGLEAAYEQRRYRDVLARADVVWANLDKGYLQGDEQRTFVTEMACRAGFQLHMQGRTSASHARWCGYWVERLERAGADTVEAKELLGQVE